MRGREEECDLTREQLEIHTTLILLTPHSNRSIRHTQLEGEIRQLIPEGIESKDVVLFVVSFTLSNHSLVLLDLVGIRNQPRHLNSTRYRHLSSTRPTSRSTDRCSPLHHVFHRNILHDIMLGHLSKRSTRR